MEERDPNAEGQGSEPLVNPDRPLKDLRLLRMAARFNMPEATRQKLVDAMGQLLDHDKPRTKVAAARVLIAADKNNLEREKMDQRDEHREQDRKGPDAETIGTTLTPDQDVAEMDASVPRAPEPTETEP